MRGKEVKLIYEIVKLKINRLQRKCSNKSSGENSKTKYNKFCPTYASMCFSSKRKLYKIKVM